MLAHFREILLRIYKESRGCRLDFFGLLWIYSTSCIVRSRLFSCRLFVVRLNTNELVYIERQNYAIQHKIRIFILRILMYSTKRSKCGQQLANKAHFHNKLRIWNYMYCTSIDAEHRKMKIYKIQANSQ